MTSPGLKKTPYEVKPLKGKAHKGHYCKVSGRYRIIFKPIHSTHTVELLAILLRKERTYS